LGGEVGTADKGMSIRGAGAETWELHVSACWGTVWGLAGGSKKVHSSSQYSKTGGKKKRIGEVET